MNVWIVAHPSFQLNQPLLNANKKGRRLAAIVRKIFGVNPKWITRTKDLNWLQEDVAPHPAKYPDIILWSGRIGSRVSFDDGCGGRDHHYWGDGTVENLEEFIFSRIPNANPAFYKFKERLPRSIMTFLVTMALSAFLPEKERSGSL